MVHVADHLVDIETAFKELSRVLQSGGRLAFSTYSGFVFHHLPMFRLMGRFSERLANNYKEWRCRRTCVWHGYSPYICDNPEEATGQNLYSISQWKELGKRYSLDLIEYRPFTVGAVWTSMVDLQYRGDPRMFKNALYRLVSHMVAKEVRGDQKLDERAANLFMIFQKSERI